MVSSLVTGAVAVLLILISGYVIIGGILTMSETVFYTQSDMTLMQQKKLNTNINILYSENTTTSFLIGVSNNGSTYFGGSDFGKMDLFIGYNDGTVTRSSITNHYTIINDRVNQKMWDESEIMNVSFSGLTPEPVWVKLVTPNGVTASKNL